MNAIAKFFTRRRKTQNTNTNESTNLGIQEELASNTDTSFFQPSTYAMDFAMELDESSHQYFYNIIKRNIAGKVSNMKAYYHEARYFSYSIPESEMPPKSVMAQLILDGFQLEYRNNALHITLPVSKIENEANMHLENFFAQMEATKAKEAEEAKRKAEENAKVKKDLNTDNNEILAKTTNNQDSD